MPYLNLSLVLFSIPVVGSLRAIASMWFRDDQFPGQRSVAYGHPMKPTKAEVGRPIALSAAAMLEDGNSVTCSALAMSVERAAASRLTTAERTLITVTETNA